MDEREVVTVASNGLSQLTVAEIDQQVATARKYPRSVSRFLKEVETMATLNQQVADDCTYALPRKDKNGQTKTIEGPSARFAEIVASAWGNCRAGARIVAEDDQFVTAQGLFHDLERNVAVTFEVRRRITDRNGRKFSADMVVVTGNAAASIALRNAVFKGVPKAYWQTAHEASRRVSMGDAKTLGTRRIEAITYLQKFGVTEAQVLTALEVRAVEDITLDHLGVLKGIATALRDGDTTVEQAFPTQQAPVPPAAATTPQIAAQPEPVVLEMGTLDAQAETEQPKVTKKARTQAAPVEPAPAPAVDMPPDVLPLVPADNATLVLPWEPVPNGLIPRDCVRVSSNGIERWTGKAWMRDDSQGVQDWVTMQCRKIVVQHFRTNRMERAAAMAWAASKAERVGTIATLNELTQDQLMLCVQAAEQEALQ